MSATDAQHDVIVIGGGPGGYAAALYGAGIGLDIGLVEYNIMGGTCLNVGCIPAKELLETAHVFRTVGHAADFGVNSSAPTIEWGTTLTRKQSIVDQLVGGLSGLLKQRKVTVYNGKGSLGADRTVQVTGGESGDLTLQGKAVILAAGSTTRTIPGFEVDGKVVMTSDEVLSMPELPGSAVVIGGGAIGCEFASMMGDLGVTVTVLEALPQILNGCDPDATKVVERSFKKRGITTRTGVMVNGHTPRADGSGTTVHFGDGESVDVDAVIVSVGRRPFADLLGLEGTAVGVDERGFVQVDDRCRTAEAGVWAVGDIVNTPQLAHVAFAEGMLAIRDILGEEPAPLDHHGTPWCIYCHPEVAFAGHTEASAKEAGFEVVTSKHHFVGNGRAKIVGDTEGLVKVIAEKRPDGTGGRILGVHMVGPWVTEQLGQGYMAVNWEATVDEVAAFIQPHPTMSELFGETVLSLTGRGLHG
ncbi:MAG: dihydrolipoyl dehydrogenase [Actinomycetota bacterium]